jgi:septal ring-binding cell division protein DamX
VAIVAAVLALALAGLVVAFLAVSDDSDELTRIAQGTTQAVPGAPTPAPPAPTPAPPAATPTPTPTATATASPDATTTPDPAASGADPSPSDDAAGGDVGSWPEGRSGWTVVLLSSPDRAGADERARELAGAGTEVGVLDSDDFSSLRGGYYVVFSGRYGSRDRAEAALAALPDAGEAYVRRVIPR